MPPAEIRPPALAGHFYPADPQLLNAEIQRMLAPCVPDRPHRLPRALIVPHAGYVYSGLCAAHAFARLVGISGSIRQVVIVGPAHRVRVDGIALSSALGFETPLGVVPCSTIPACDDAAINDEAHRDEHAIEVQLPFLQTVAPRAQLLAGLVGDCAAATVERFLQPFWNDPASLIVVSTDLSHFHDEPEATAMDRATCAAIQDCRDDMIGANEACGSRPLGGLLRLCRRDGVHPELLERRTSADAGGPRQRVVGYAAFIAA